MLSKDGHWFEYNRAVSRLHKAYGVSTTIVCHERFADRSELEAEGIEVLSIVARSVWAGDGAGKEGIARELVSAMSLGYSFAAVLRRVLRERRFDCVFAPNARISDALAWWVLKKQGYLPHAGRLALFFRFGLGDIVDDGPPRFARKLKVWRPLLRSWRKAIASGQVQLLTDSSRLAAEYDGVSGVRPVVAPSPRTMAQRTAETHGDGELLFATLGAARMEKGIDVFQCAIAKLLRSGKTDNMRFLIQWNRDVPLKSGGSYKRDPLLQASEKVTFIETPLPSGDYDAMFERIDCMVLPYRRSMYHSQISGVAVEAACAGIPIIYTQDTWLADFTQELGSGLGIRDGNVDDLADAMVKIASKRDFYTKQARERAAVAQHANSGEAFLRTLWGLDDRAVLEACR